MMRKIAIIFTLALSMLIFTSCSNITELVQKFSGENGNDEENSLNEMNNEEENDDLVEVGNNDTEMNENDDVEIEEGLATEFRTLDVDSVLLDQKELDYTSEIDRLVIELEELRYIEHEFITEVLDYELTYDEENTYVEIFEEKGDYKYEPAYESDEGVILDVGQVYVGETDKYENISDEEEKLFKFIEYDDRLYISERFINRFMKSPTNIDRRSNTLEIGIMKESVRVEDIELSGQTTTSKVDATESSQHVTVEGENHGGGILFSNLNSSAALADVYVNYQYSEVEGFIHNFSDEYTHSIEVKYDSDKVHDAFEVKPGKTKKINYPLKGKEFFKIYIEGPGGTSSEAVLIGNVR